MLSIVGENVSLLVQIPIIVKGVEDISIVLPIGFSSPNNNCADVSSNTATVANFELSRFVMPLPCLIVSPAVEK